jgi:hypothetical protein
MGSVEIGGRGSINQIPGRFPIQGGSLMEKVSVRAGLWEGLPMEKGGLIQLVRRILKSDTDLNFLLKLEPKEIETLVACIRVRLELENRFFTA